MSNELRKYIRSIISENLDSMDNIGEESIEQEIKHIVQDVAEHKTTVDDAVFSILHIADFVSNYAHTATMTPSMNESVVGNDAVLNMSVSGAASKDKLHKSLLGLADILTELTTEDITKGGNVNNDVIRATFTFPNTKVVGEEAQEIDEERITNDEGKEFAKMKDNFIGSHCWGEKLGDGSYVVMSYGKQFPLYIFWNKKNKWYENADHYLYDGEPQESTEEHRADLRPTDETRKKQADWMRKLSAHLLKVNGMTDYEHISVEPGTKN